MLDLIPFVRRWRRRAERLPLMTQAETELLRRHLRKRRLVVEYGAGASTLFALANGVRRIISVESDPLWLARLRDDPELVRARATLVHADIGPVKEWGFPKDDAARPRWPGYARAPWPVTGEAMVLVDGRFRVACALTSALNTSGPILVHDYFSRPHYHVIEEHLALVDRVDDLAVFRGLRSSRQTVSETIATFEFTPD